MKKAASLIVSGKVQGVGFRYFAQLTAMDHQVTGWVKNLDTGSVEIHAEGTAEQLRLFVSALKQGNRFARVHDIQEALVPAKHFSSFKITY